MKSAPAPIADDSRDLLLAWVVASACLNVLLGTSPDYAMAWDEGHTIRRERRLAAWFAMVAEGGSARELAFTPPALRHHWPFSREEPDGHPPFYALLGLGGWWASHRWAEPLASYRFGPMALASITLGLLCYHLATRRGRLAGVVAGCALVLMPRAFSHAHYAHYDMPMSCLWLLAQLAFLRSLRHPGWVVAFGVCLGLSAGTKVTGCFAVVPPLLWSAWAEWRPRLRLAPGSGAGDRPAPLAATRALVLGGVIAALTLYAIQPPWWSDPIGGLARFLASNLTRSQTNPIPTMYLGRIYRFALPWHNTLVLTAATVPLATLGLGLVGIASVVSRRSPPDGEGWLWVLSWLTLMVVRALPMAPGHDGIRLFLPSLMSLAVLAGLGAQAIWDRAGPSPARWLAPALVVLALGEGLTGIARLYPYTLSYYNAAVGGLPGAERLGFELTYYWDTLGEEFFAWARREQAARDLELRFPSGLVNIPYLREWGTFPDGIPVLGDATPTTHEDYVLQRRRGVYRPYDWWLERHGRPCHRIRREGVDLVRIYPFAESFRAYMATRDQPTPSYLK